VVLSSSPPVPDYFIFPPPRCQNNPGVGKF